MRQMQAMYNRLQANRYGSVTPRGPVLLGARILHAHPQQGARSTRPLAAPTRQSSGVSYDLQDLLEPLKNVQADADFVRLHTARLQRLAPEVAAIWQAGVDRLYSMPLGVREPMLRLQEDFDLQPLQIDLCARFLEKTRGDLRALKEDDRRDRTLEFAAVGTHAMAQACSLQAAESSSPELYRRAMQDLRHGMAQRSVHAQLVLNLLKFVRPAEPMA